MNEEEKEFLIEQKSGVVADDWLKKQPRAWYKLFLGRTSPQKVSVEEVKDNGIMMLYIDEDRKAKIIKNVKSGDYDNKKLFEKKKVAYNKVLTSKAIECEYDGYKFPLVLQYQREFLPYPYEPKNDNQIISNLIEGLRTNYIDFDTKRDSLGKTDWMQIIKMFGYFVAIVLGAWYAYYLFIQPLQAKAVVETVVPVIQQNLTNLDNLTRIGP